MKTNGRIICDELKRVRLELAKANGIDYQPTVCNHQGECSGTRRRHSQVLISGAEEGRSSGIKASENKKDPTMKVEAVIREALKML